MSTTTASAIIMTLGVGLPWVYLLRRSQLSWPTVVSLLLLAHTLAILLSRPPPNVFKALQIPFNTPTDVIRALLLQKSDFPELGNELDELLRRLSSYEVRSLYSRFGHNVVTTCSYCHSFRDFAFYYIPRPMMAYLCEATLIGIITTQRRKAAMLILILAFVSESCLLFMAEIKIPNRDAPLTTFWWHDNVLNARHALFALLPLAVHFVPNFRIPFLSRPSPPSIADTSSNLVQTHQTLSHLVSALHLLKYGQAATMRVPELRERASNWWEEEAKVGAWIREDGSDEPDSATSVNNVARRLGISFDRGREGVEEGKLRTSAKLTTKVLMIDGLKSTPHLQAQPDQRE